MLEVGLKEPASSASRECAGRCGRLLLADRPSSSVVHASGMLTWLGVDVGGSRKGFDVAVVDEQRLVFYDHRLRRDDVVSLVQRHHPAVVAIDSPRGCAPAGKSTRECELEVNRKVCGIRWTPDRATVFSTPRPRYYEWIRNGLELYDALATRDVDLIEVFPTASWTRWHGKRTGSRAAWSRAALAALALKDVPERTNQDQRDAIAAALTARAHSRGDTEALGEIIVPLAPNGER